MAQGRTYGVTIKTRLVMVSNFSLLTIAPCEAPKFCYLNISNNVDEFMTQTTSERAGRAFGERPGACSGLRSGAWPWKRNNGRLGAFN